MYFNFKHYSRPDSTSIDYTIKLHHPFQFTFMLFHIDGFVSYYRFIGHIIV